MSYYTSKHPGLYAYIALLALSTAAFIITPGSAVMIGTLSVLWGLVCMMRALALHEVGEYFERAAPKTTTSKISNTQSAPLAYDLTKRMAGNSHFKRGLAALECLDARTLLWFGLAALYAVCAFYLAENGTSKAISYQDLSLFFIIGAAFWIGQSYAYSASASKLLGSSCAALFLGALYLLMPGDSANLYMTLLNKILSDPSFIMLGALIAYTLGVLTHALINKPRKAPLVITGFALLAAMSYAHLTLPTSTQNLALWVPGWALFALIWIRAYTNTEKRYTLYPC